jgi:tRNA (guanine37-N1)-methyltransferase
MNYHVITIFPEMLSSYLGESIIGSAIKNKIISVNTYALREHTTDKHRRVDGKPFAGGPGMVMWVDPIVNCVEKIKTNIEKKYQKDISKYELIKEKQKIKVSKTINIKPKKSKILFVHFNPGAEKFTTSLAKDISKNYTDIIFICGRYEGIDSRINEIYKGLEISIGDYVLTGGELPSLIMIDSISRQIEGVLNKMESLEENRVSSHKVYARPEVYEYKTKTKTGKLKIKKYLVPKVLLSGNHKEIEKWKLENK